MLGLPKPQQFQLMKLLDSSGPPYQGPSIKKNDLRKYLRTSMILVGWTQFVFRLWFDVGVGIKLGSC